MWILAIFIRGVDSVCFFFFYNVFNIINRRLDFGEQTCQINVEYMLDKRVLDVAVVFFITCIRLHSLTVPLFRENNL